MFWSLDKRLRKKEERARRTAQEQRQYAELLKTPANSPMPSNGSLIIDCTRPYLLLPRDLCTSVPRHPFPNRVTGRVR
jgi:hypothetical protein